MESGGIRDLRVAWEDCWGGASSPWVTSHSVCGLFLNQYSLYHSKYFLASIMDMYWDYGLGELIKLTGTTLQRQGWTNIGKTEWKVMTVIWGSCKTNYSVYYRCCRCHQGVYYCVSQRNWLHREGENWFGCNSCSSCYVVQDMEGQSTCAARVSISDINCRVRLDRTSPFGQLLSMQECNMLLCSVVCAITTCHWSWQLSSSCSPYWMEHIQNTTVYTQNTHIIL